MMRWRKFDLKDSPMYDMILAWMNESEYDARKRRDRVCRKCHYAALNGQNQKVLYCDYMMMTGHNRPCSPLDCVKEGIFQQADGTQRRCGLSISKGGLTCEKNG